MRKKEKTAFGQYLVEQIEAAGMFQIDFYTELGITKPYFYDLLRGSPPPTDLQNRMLALLEEKTGTDPDRRTKFYDLAASGRNEIPADILTTILDHKNDYTTIRKALDELFKEKE